MDGTDEFVLDGERLIPCARQTVKAPSCVTGGTHSTQRETYRRISRAGDSWTIWDRDGTRSTSESWPGKASGTVFALAARRNTHGDSVAYRRWCDGDDACYLAEIEYRDAGDAAKRTRVRFYYEERPVIFKQLGVGLVVAS